MHFSSAANNDFPFNKTRIPYFRILSRFSLYVLIKSFLGTTKLGGIWPRMPPPSPRALPAAARFSNPVLFCLLVRCAGMSTVQEVVTARHAGMRVVACSLVTNKCILEYDSKETVCHEEVLEVGKMRAKDAEKIVARFVEKITLN